MIAGPLNQAQICADIATSDLPRARAFYEGVLGLSPAHEDEDRGVYYRAGGGTMLNLYERAHEPAAQTAATFLIDDLDKAMAALRERGVSFIEYDEADLKTVDGVFEDGTGFRVCWFRDPDGNLLSLEQLA
jgi:catechol 2,3-dioxygenase-like lactoylglutathione lyase family enzyme